jgi:phytoene desaturase
MHIGIIGAGFAGLSSACYLAKQGHKVTVLEKNKEIGGRARLWKHEGYTFDMGPSWYLMPEVFEQFFEHFDKDLKDYYKLSRLDPYYRVFFDKEDSVDVTADLNKTKELFESFEPGGAKKLEKYLKSAEYKYNTAMSEFLYREYKSIFQFFNRKLMIEGTKMGVFQRLDKFVSKYFSSRRAKQILEYAMVFLGTSPVKAPALYSIMSHVDLNLGVFFPEGGMGAVALGMAKLAEELGAEIKTSQDVKKILVKDKKAYGVKTAEGEQHFDLVLASSDYAHTEMELLEPQYQSYKEKYWEKAVVAPSMFLIYLGVNKKLPKLTHHNLYFRENWSEHFDTIFEKPSWPEDPCFYVSAITNTEKEMAPKGKENVFILVPVAPGLDDNDEIRKSYAEKTLEHVERITGESIRDHIDIMRVYSHRDFKEDYNAFKGTALSLAHTLFQTAIFRPAHRSKKVKNLYFTGQYTHPGVGVPMTIIASELVAKEIKAHKD